MMFLFRMSCLQGQLLAMIVILWLVFFPKIMFASLNGAAIKRSMKMKKFKIFWLLWHFIVKSFNGWFEKKRKCPIGETDCETCSFRLQCTFHLLDGCKQ